jgi:hypothetical protein
MSRSELLITVHVVSFESSWTVFQAIIFNDLKLDPRER